MPAVETTSPPTVYVVGLEQGGARKIGFTSLPVRQRLFQLRNYYGLQTLQVLAHIKYSYHLEEMLHSFFGHVRLFPGSEWFAITLDTDTLEALAGHAQAMTALARQTWPRDRRKERKMLFAEPICEDLVRLIDGCVTPDIFDIPLSSWMRQAQAGYGIPPFPISEHSLTPVQLALYDGQIFGDTVLRYQPTVYGTPALHIVCQSPHSGLYRVLWRLLPKVTPQGQIEHIRMYRGYDILALSAARARRHPLACQYAPGTEDGLQTLLAYTVQHRRLA
jgi:hypothetical protein